MFSSYIYIGMHLPEQYVHSIHTASVHTLTSVLLSSNVESSQQAVGSLLSEYLYPRTWMSVVYVLIHTQSRKYTPTPDTRIDGFYRVFSIATDACCYARPGQRCHVFGSSASRTSACLCWRPSRRPSRRSIVTHGETFFALFAT